MKCKPSSISEVYWSHSLRDLRTLTKITYGFHAAQVVQQYETFASVVSAALGGKKKKTEAPQYNSVQEAQLALARVLGG
ncbi:hypothetical protein [Inquilinus limosus]|uniref:hypothetical protein n=1 Tax=Inquilinus limosus TaxID=171674 RepID=UPI00126A5758|nr:hypothetical protein [Inquilinus limosus]